MTNQQLQLHLTPDEVEFWQACVTGQIQRGERHDHALSIADSLVLALRQRLRTGAGPQARRAG